MIGKLRGIIDTIGEDMFIIDVAGVGYTVFCSNNTLRVLPAKGGEASIVIETHVREDHIHLYGFATNEEKKAFLTLNKVSGVGAKMALAILSIMSPAQLASALAAQDASAFKSASGVGPKLAARIVSELKDKFSFISTNIQTDITSGTSLNIPVNNISDAVSALVNLGYGRTDAYNVITKIAAKNDNMPLDSLIREGLKELGRK